MKFITALKQTIRDLTNEYLAPLYDWVKLALVLLVLFVAVLGFIRSMEYLIVTNPVLTMQVFIFSVGVFIVYKVSLTIIRTFMRNYNK